MRLFLSYLKARRGYFGIFALFGAVFIIAFMLYRLPLMAVIYPAALCVLFGIVAMAVDFARFKKKHGLMQDIKKLGAAMADVLPECDNLPEEDYTELIRALCREEAEMQINDAAAYRDMVDYYTVWAHQIKTPIQNQFNITVNELDSLSDGTVEIIEDSYEKVFDDYGVEPQNVVKYAFGYATGLMVDEDKIDLDADPYSSGVGVYENLRELYFISEDDYNAATGKNVSVNKGEALVCTRGCEYDRDSFRFKGIELKIVGEFESFASFGDANAAITPSVMFVIHDMEELRPLDGLTDESFGYPVLGVHWFYGYDLDENEETQINVYNDQQKALGKLGAKTAAEAEPTDFTYSCDCLAVSRSDFFQAFGGLFFVAIMLSVVFIFAAAMIIYYKQVSEGYEDKSRFEIMQNVGMTKADIKKSINSQVLTVFFAPLIMAGVHLAFAFPLVWKLLQLFYLKNLSLAIWVTVASFVAFALIYAIIYKITAGAYYKIVSEKE